MWCSASSPLRLLPTNHATLVVLLFPELNRSLILAWPRLIGGVASWAPKSSPVGPMFW